MLAYLIPTENRYVRTQGEAKKLGFGDSTDIPTDKDGLLEFVNNLLRARAEVQYADDAPVVPNDPSPDLSLVQALPEVQAIPMPSKPLSASYGPEMGADAVLARMDNPGLDVDGIVERIAKMKGGYALKRVAGALAIRFEELSK